SRGGEPSCTPTRRTASCSNITPSSPRMSTASCSTRRRRDDVPKLLARGNAELGEHFAEVPFDRSLAEVEQARDLSIGLAVTSEPRDLVLLWRELLSRVVGALAYLLTRRIEFSARTFAERLHADVSKYGVRGAQMNARIDSSSCAT